MATYRATVDWSLGEGQDFVAGRYSRAHTLIFDGGVNVPGSASPSHVPSAFALDAAVDPEEAFVSSLSSCHMLWFLYLACKEGLSVSRYRDEAEGVMAKNDKGRMAMTKVTLKPYIVFNGNQPAANVIEHLHHRAHEECYIANSVLTEVVVIPQPAPPGA